MEPEDSLPQSQVPTTCPYPEPVRSSPHSLIPLLKTHLNIILPSASCLPSGLFPSGFPTKTLYTPLLFPIRATCPASLILDFITRTVLGEEYRSGHTRCNSVLKLEALRSIKRLWHVATQNRNAGLRYRETLDSHRVGQVSRLFSLLLLQHLPWYSWI